MPLLAQSAASVGRTIGRAIQGDSAAMTSLIIGGAIAAVLLLITNLPVRSK